MDILAKIRGWCRDVHELSDMKLFSKRWAKGGVMGLILNIRRWFYDYKAVVGNKLTERRVGVFTESETRVFTNGL